MFINWLPDDCEYPVQVMKKVENLALRHCLLMVYWHDFITKVKILTPFQNLKTFSERIYISFFVRCLLESISSKNHFFCFAFISSSRFRVTITCVF